MDEDIVLNQISQGRTDLVFELMKFANWQALLESGTITPMQWFVYYDDTTALQAVLSGGGTLDSLDLDAELLNASFFGHWKVCDFLLQNGANVNCKVESSGETPLHGALAKAGRPHFIYTIRLLLDHGADVNATTNANQETDAFMRDVRTKGETPLHRAAAYAGAEIIELLLEHGADKEKRDANGDSPLSWASEHLRPGNILSLLAFGEFQVGPNHRTKMTSDHGAGWGNGMEWNLMGEYVPRSIGDE